MQTGLVYYTCQVGAHNYVQFPPDLAIVKRHSILATANLWKATEKYGHSSGMTLTNSIKCTKLQKITQNKQLKFFQLLVLQDFAEKHSS